MTSRLENIKQTAATWYSRELTGDLSIEEQNAFEDWLADDAQHAIEYAKMDTTWAVQGRDHQRRGEHLLDRSRGRDDESPGCPGDRGRWDAG